MLRNHLLLLAALTMAQAVSAQQTELLYRLNVYRGAGSGDYEVGTRVTISAKPPPPGEQFAGWTGDTAILSNPFLATTSALVPSMSVAVFANYTGPRDKIRFRPRPGYADRMVGGYFEGTQDLVNGTYTRLFVVTSAPTQGWSEVGVSLDSYRYLLYRSPIGSYGNVAEIEFYRDWTKLLGLRFGTPGSWNNSGNTFEKALDGDVNTFFDAPAANGNYVGIDVRPKLYDRFELGAISPLSINNAGQMVGTSGGRAGLLNEAGSSILDLGTLGGPTSSASSINDAGQIVGWAALSDGTQRATLFSGTGTGNADLGTLGGSSSRAHAINNSGQIVGEAEAAGETLFRATRFGGTAAGNTDLSSPFGGPHSSAAYAINNAGPIVGVEFAGATLFGATGSGNVRLGSGAAYGMSDAGTIVGDSDAVMAPYRRRAMIWSGPNSGLLDTLSIHSWPPLGGGYVVESLARAINSSGQVIGSSSLFTRFGSSETLSFISSAESVTNLDANTPWVYDINDWGQIVGDSGEGGVLLNPIDPLRSTSGGVTNIKFVGGMAYSKFIPFAEPGGLKTGVALIDGTTGSGGYGPYRRNRDVDVSFAARGASPIASDVVNLTGTAGDGFADTLALQISYDEALANTLFGSESEARLNWLDPHTGRWVLATAHNTGGTSVFAGDRAYNPATDFVPGYYGVDTASNTVWAVINRSGSFAVGSAAHVPESDKIKYYPRSGWSQRMVGGIFEGTNGDPVNGPYTAIYTVTSSPPLAWNEVSVSLGSYRYLRYRGPNGSYGNVAEIEFYRGGVRVSGATFGTPGSWNNSGNTFEKALDANANTFFDASTSDGAYVGIDTGAPVLGDNISFYPRAGWTGRMVGGVFEGTNGDPIDGPYTAIYTVTSNPPLGLNVANVNLGSYRYLRYRGPNGSHGNVAEIAFYRNGVRLTGTGFGSPGSWSNSGATFMRALDGDFTTFFDAPTSDGAYVGIDTQ